ncbi:hypothetical protein [uncultured Thiodictyon sp.]|uniref:hypothetical protein n=1 Tax=uncultured Thiodictyon sp. TaxID=1846217 RepID=UPI0025D01230|nr:hypothetical protein [uncultured Thiodictyon sp.]
MNPTLAPQHTTPRRPRAVRFARAAWLLLAYLGGSTALAAVPQVINYQGYLADAAGKAVQGNVTVTFKLYASATATTPLWTGTYPVTATAGFLEQDLGPIALDFASPVYIGVTVNNDAEMTPRRLLTSVPYAYRALSAENDRDTLGSLSCASGQIAKWSGTAWQCGADAAGTSGISGVTAGAGLAGGGTSGTVALSIPSGGVTTAMIAADAVDGTKVADGTIASADVAFPYAASATKGGDAAGLTCTGCVAGNEIAGAQVVKSVNGLTDAVTVQGGTGITISAAANAITIAAAAAPAQAVTVVDASNIGSVTVTPGSMVQLRERISLASVSGYTRALNKDNLHIQGGGFIGTGTEQIDLGRYAVIANTYFENVRVYSINATFQGCEFGNNVIFDGVDPTFIAGRFGPGALSIFGGTFIGGVMNSVQLGVNYSISTISSMSILSSNVKVERLQDSDVGDTQLSVGRARGNRFRDTKATLSSGSVFSENFCTRCSVQLPNAVFGQVLVSDNHFQDLLATEGSIIWIQATDNWWRNFIISDNTFIVQPGDQSAILVTGSPTGTYQTLKISGNSFMKGSYAIIYVGNFKTIVTDNLVRATQLGVTDNGIYNWVQNNIVLP